MADPSHTTEVEVPADLTESLKDLETLRKEVEQTTIKIKKLHQKMDSRKFTLIARSLLFLRFFFISWSSSVFLNSFGPFKFCFFKKKLLSSVSDTAKLESWARLRTLYSEAISLSEKEETCVLNFFENYQTAKQKTKHFKKYLFILFIGFVDFQFGIAVFGHG